MKSAFIRITEQLQLGISRQRKDWSFDESKAIRQTRRNTDRCRAKTDEQRGEDVLKRNPDLTDLINNL